MKRVALITFGCAKNLVDSEVMAGYLRNAGYAAVADPSQADVIVLNTCGFIGPAKKEADRAIREALRHKRRSPEKRVVVTGCYSERYRPELARQFPAVDAFIGVKDFDRIVAVVEKTAFPPGRRTFLYDHETPRALSTPASWAYLKISEGCSHRCAFCSIPLIKGRYRSRPVASIIEEARHLGARGVREVVLVSQDSTAFGHDRGRRNGLARLLDRLAGLDDITWIRILYGYPGEITDALLDAMSRDKVCSYLDIPFQHADCRLLQSMKRAMDSDRSLKLLEKIRNRLPDVSLRTSLMVGFPGEGRAEFEGLKSFVRRARFDHLGVFTYSAEDGTSAFRLGDPVSPKTKEGRRAEIMAIQAEISRDKMRTYIGRTIDVLIEGPDAARPSTTVGRARFQAPEVDGVVLIDRPVASRPGPVVKVEITSSGIYDLRGREVP